MRLDRDTIAAHLDEVMKIPLFPLDLVLFPGATLPLHIFEERYKEMIGECIETGMPFGVVRQQKDGLAVIGCTARVTRVLERYDDGRMEILCVGEERFEIESLEENRSFLEAEVELFQDDGADASRGQREECAALHFETMELAGMEMPALPLSLDRPISFELAASLPSDLGFRQQLLGARSDALRTKYLCDFYHAVLPKLRLDRRPQAKSTGHVM